MFLELKNLFFKGNLIKSNQARLDRRLDPSRLYLFLETILQINSLHSADMPPLRI